MNKALGRTARSRKRPRRRPTSSLVSGETHEAPNIFPLGASDQERLENLREVAVGYLADAASRSRYETSAGKLGTIRAVLNAGFLGPDNTDELQSLGVVFGDALSQESDLEWVAIEDEYGRDPALCIPETTILAYPLTMISKRVEEGAEIDVFKLFDQVLTSIQRMRDEGYT